MKSALPRKLDSFDKTVNKLQATYTMPEFTVSDGDLAPLSGKVVVVTGCSSGIGLATVQELLKIGAKVVGGDLSDPKSAVDSRDFEFVQVNVTDWKALCILFKHAISEFGRIDHVFANAGAYCLINDSGWRKALPLTRHIRYRP